MLVAERRELTRRAFKTDESFLEKISIGAIGTSKVFEDLKTKGHFPIELERGSTSFKIWKKIKIKRVRVPDILCINCGRRFESRAKTALKITMSHSFSNAERGWDFGLDDSDLIALVKCARSGDRPIDWKADDLVQYVYVKDMRDALHKNRVVSEKPKGATEGFEARLTWPSAVANFEGVVSKIADDCMKYKRNEDNRTIRVSLKRRGLKLAPLVKTGSAVKKNQIIASVVPVYDAPKCEKNPNKLFKHYLSLIESVSLSDRYAAVKALPYFKSTESIESLTERMKDDKEHIYVRLEAASGLLKMGKTESISFFEKTLDDPYLQNRLECVIILGEIDSNVLSRNLLIRTLSNEEQHPEIRAGAAWALGELRNKEAIEALVKAFDNAKIEIRMEAARALVKINEKFPKDTIALIPKSSEFQKAGISWSLSKSGNFSVADLLPVMIDDDARKWIAWVIGTQKEEKFLTQIEQLKKKDPEVYFAVTVLWKVMSSWVNGLEIY